MEKIKQLNTLIDQACSDVHNQPPLKLYADILSTIESRVDLPKYSIAAISKKLTHKSKKVLFITFDLLQYLSYNLELPFFSQIATKEFLFKISGLLMNKETEPVMIDKVLKLIKCLDELFRPLQDFLPLFFQFEAGLLRKQYQIPYEYVSPYRPKQLKKYKKPQNFEQKNKKLVIQPTKDQQKRFEQIRQKIILVNQIITNSDPGEDIRKNDLLIELVEQLKQSQKIINSTIDQNPTQRIMQLALATNDDLVTTYRRFKDLQRNRKPEMFIMAQLASDVAKQNSKPTKKFQNEPKNNQLKIQSKPEPQKFQSIFEAFDLKNNNNSPQKQKPANEAKIPAQNIFDLLGGEDEKQSEATQASKIITNYELMDIVPAQNQYVQQNNSTNFDLLSSGSSSNQQNNIDSLMSQMFTMNLGMSQSPVKNVSQSSSKPIYELPTSLKIQLPFYQQNSQIPNYQSGIYQPQNSQSNLNQEFLISSVVSQPVAQQPIYQNISLKLSELPKNEEKQEMDPIKNLTNLSDQFKF